jgi:hypothetical protein
VLFISITCLVLALGFGAGWFFSRQASALAAALLWLAAPLYNTLLMANCPGDCGIRIDLLLALPLLLIVSLAALLQMIRQAMRRKKARLPDA